MGHMRVLAWLPLLVCTACASSKTGGAATNDTPPSAAPFAILDAQVDGDSLRTTLQFGGGFRQHTFTVEALGAPTKSLPRQHTLRLLHDADGDMGRALLTETHAFDLQPYRDPSRPTVVIRLEGWEGRLEYTYTP